MKTPNIRKLGWLYLYQKIIPSTRNTTRDKEKLLTMKSTNSSKSHENTKTARILLQNFKGGEAKIDSFKWGKKEKSTNILDIGRIGKQKTSKHMENLNHIINQLDLIEIYRTLYLTVVEHTLFEAHATYIKIDITHVMNYLNIFQRMKS